MAFRHLLHDMTSSRWLLDSRFAESQIGFLPSMLAGNHEYEERRDIQSRIDAGEFGQVVTTFGWIGYLDTKGVAHFPIEGAIFRMGGYCAYGADDYQTAVGEALANPDTKGMMFHVNSPGGDAIGGQMMAAIVRSASQAVPTTVHVDYGMAASAAYWLASQAGSIYASTPIDDIGSIGAFVVLTDFSEMLEKAGVKVHEVFATQSTEKLLEVNQAFSGDYASLRERWLDPLVETFHAQVATGRGDRLKSDAWKTGKLFHADEALEMGLIDGIASKEEAYNALIQQIEASSTENKLMFGNTKELRTELDATKATLSAAQADLVTLTASASEAQAALEASLNEVSTQAATIESLTAQLATAQAEVTRLGALPSGGSTKVPDAGDESNKDSNAFVPTAGVEALENNPLFRN